MQITPIRRVTDERQDVEDQEKFGTRMRRSSFDEILVLIGLMPEEE
jgi:hypothetical protein